MGMERHVGRITQVAALLHGLAGLFVYRHQLAGLIGWNVI